LWDADFDYLFFLPRILAMELFPGRRAIRETGLAAFCLVLIAALASVHTTAQPACAQVEPAAIADAPDKGEAEQPSPPLFTHIIKSAGPVFGLILLAVSIALVALIVLLAMDLRSTVAIPPAFVEQFTDTVNKRRIREAYELARQNDSFLARVLAAGMARLQYGIEDARETAFHTVESIKASKDQLISYLATIGTLGPMIGLVGTVYGMILAFMELGQQGKTPNPARLADAISHALVITLLGIALAVPAIFCHAFFRNRLVRMGMDTANVADDLLTQMYHSSKRPAPAVMEPRVPVSTPVKPAEG
jgi:biopolymer transport protein ExbB